MQLVTIAVLLTSRRGARGYRGHDRDRRPGMPAGAEGKPDRGPGGASRRPDGAGGGGQRKPGDNRGGKPQQGQGDRQRQGQGQGQGRPGQSPINPVEMSLRDVNQRLKNAEREQDNARRSIRGDGDGADGDGRDRDGRQQRGGGGRDGGRDGGRNDRDRGPRRDGGRDNRNRDGGRPDRQNDGGRPPRDRGQFRQEDAGHSSPATERLTGPEIIPDGVGTPEEQLQHGRRFAAKRRILPDSAGGPEEAEPAPREQSTLFDNAENTPQETSTANFDGQEQPGNEDIQFGR